MPGWLSRDQGFHGWLHARTDARREGMGQELLPCAALEEGWEKTTCPCPSRTLRDQPELLTALTGTRVQVWQDPGQDPVPSWSQRASDSRYPGEEPSLCHRGAVSSLPDTWFLG